MVIGSMLAYPVPAEVGCKLLQWVKVPRPFKEFKLKRFPYRIKREVTYTEDVEAIIVAKDEKAAERIAADLGEGADPHWPDIDRYNVVDKTAQSYELIELELAGAGA